MEELIVKLRLGPDAHLYSLLGSDHLWTDPKDVEAVCLTDLRVLARYLNTRIYVWYPAEGDKPDRWMSLGATHRTVNEPAIYLAFTTSLNLGHCVVATKVKKLK